jgi:hypothetical protein
MTYSHTQRAPLCLLLYLVSAAQLTGAYWALQTGPAWVGWLLVGVGLLVGLLGASFQHLTVADEVDRLAIRFGPAPLFHRLVPYDEIVSVDTGRTTVLDGWGIHYSLKGGWVWNLWGYDCVVVTLNGGRLFIGTDDPHGLAEFLRERVAGAREGNWNGPQ